MEKVGTDSFSALPTKTLPIGSTSTVAAIDDFSIVSSDALTTSGSPEILVDVVDADSLELFDDVGSPAAFRGDGFDGSVEAFIVDGAALPEPCADDHDEGLSGTLINDGLGEATVSLGMGNAGWFAAFGNDDGATSESIAGGGSWPMASVDCNTTRQASTEFITILPYGHQRTFRPDDSLFPPSGDIENRR